MHGEQLAGERAHHLLLAVQGDVEPEVDPADGRDHRADVVVHGVALADAPYGVGRADALSVVQGEDGLQAREPGDAQLRAPAEPGEEVRLDEARGDPDVRLHPVSVEPHGHSVAVAAHPHEGRLVARVVVEHVDPVDDVVAQHRPELGLGVAAVGAGGHEDDDVVDVDDALDLLQHGRDHEVARLGPGAVADGDGHGLSRPHDLAQRRSRHRPAQRRPQDLGGIARAGNVPRLDDRRPVVRQVHGQPALAVGQLYPHALALLIVRRVAHLRRSHPAR
jgi:hypothetical protein